MLRLHEIDRLDARMEGKHLDCIESLKVERFLPEYANMRFLKYRSKDIPNPEGCIIAYDNIFVYFISLSL